ncbi:PhnD/SsuA/transferrin family substrate-binding protein [Ferirhizobium litorale]|uniref:PhnD/SsuA/transferrin family substrate-binding protein n=1 Tax=Ferirhizobium litorale TaxID=2927786 RepID=UPI002892CDA8|nr:PhnD/SsuA/transferrin family substrate-binding protein [Fererhizobium litorale]
MAGCPLYQSYLIVGADSVATSFDDCKGQIHAFSDPDSNSGYLVTKAYLAQPHLSEDRLFRKSFFTYGHRNVIRAVASALAPFAFALMLNSWSANLAITVSIAGSVAAVTPVRLHCATTPPAASHASRYRSERNTDDLVET